MSHRFKRLADSPGINAHLHTLRHYAATELLTAGVGLRTVADRLGHGDGSITLRHYTAWVNQADQRAASILSTRLTNGATIASGHQDLPCWRTLELIERAAWPVPKPWLERLRRAAGTSSPRIRPPKLIDPLTERERDVLRFLPSRLTIREIADELHV